MALSLAGLAGCTRAEAEEQPLPFPHRSHTENQIDCSFCHQHYETVLSAGMPETSLCGSCHSAMPQESDAAKTLMEFVETDSPIPWVRLFELPSYNQFNHKRHTKAGVECETCHGDIGLSSEPVAKQSFEMEWCMDCHEANQASNDCLVCHK